MEIPDDIRAAAIAVVNRGYKTGLIEAVAAALMAERERCAEVCRLVEQDFLSPEYATPQPAGSFAERFACREVLRGIEIPETRAIRTPSTGGREMNSNLDWLDAPRFAEMDMADVMDEFQAYEDALAFGAAFMAEVNGKLKPVHPGMCDDNLADAWRIELYMQKGDPDRIFGRIVSDHVMIAEISGALFLDKRPCCGNLEVARIIRQAGPESTGEEQ